MDMRQRERAREGGKGRERTGGREEGRQTVRGCFSSVLDEIQEMQMLRALPH